MSDARCLAFHSGEVQSRERVSYTIGIGSTEVDWSRRSEVKARAEPHHVAAADGQHFANPRAECNIHHPRRSRGISTIATHLHRFSTSMAEFLQRFLGSAKSSVSSVSTDIDAGANAISLPCHDSILIIFRQTSPTSQPPPPQLRLPMLPHTLLPRAPLPLPPPPSIQHISRAPADRTRNGIACGSARLSPTSTRSSYSFPFSSSSY